jgi:hypothetical protein
MPPEDVVQEYSVRKEFLDSGSEPPFYTRFTSIEARQNPF